jgi:hypothetical protein
MTFASVPRMIHLRSCSRRLSASSSSGAASRLIALCPRVRGGFSTHFFCGVSMASLPVYFTSPSVLLLINLDSNRFSRLDKDGAGVMMWKALEQQLALAGAFPFSFCCQAPGWGRNHGRPANTRTANYSWHPFGTSVFRRHFWFNSTVGE